MVAQLKEVIARMEELPEEEQIGLAFRIEAELESMNTVDRVTAPPGSMIDRLLADAKEQHRLGLTSPLEDLLDELPE